MIRISIEGAGGWLSLLLWAVLAVAVPSFCYWFGRESGRDDIREEIADAEQAEWMAAHAPRRIVPVPPSEQVLELTQERPDGTIEVTRYVPAPSPAVSNGGTGE